VYLGGCTTVLFINDPLSLDVRPTLNVDCLVDVVSLGEYYNFEKELNKRGFRKSLEDNIICRWHYDEIILDVMPTDEKILGFGNTWYKEALVHTITHQISKDLSIYSVTPVYFVATKIEAFRARGNNDLFASHDFEDIITVIAGRKNIVDEIASASDKLRSYLKKFFDETLKNDQFELVLPGHVTDGPITMERTKAVMMRIRKIVEIE